VTGAVAVRRRVVVSGRVQGVFFRATCHSEAAQRGVAGWVRNRPDGTLEAVFEGDPVAVDAMVDWSRRGPAYALVVGVVVHEEPVEHLMGFAAR